MLNGIKNYLGRHNVENPENSRHVFKSSNFQFNYIPLNLLNNLTRLY